MKLLLPEALRQRIVQEARAVFPHECCGLLEGVIKGDALHAIAIHSAKNLSPDNERFEIDPSDHVRAQKAARANGNVIIGCYHSHPNGHAEPSPRDGEWAWDGNFAWLIAAVIGPDVFLSAFRRAGSGWQRLETVETGGKAA